MKQLDLLWQYQELETLMASYKKEQYSLPMREELKDLGKYLLKQQDELIKFDEEAKRKENTLNRIYHEYDNIVNNLRINREKMADGSIKNLKQVEQLEKDAQTFKESAQQKEVELEKLIGEIESFSETLREIGLRITKAKKKYKDIKSVYDEQAGKIREKYDKAKKKRDGLKNDIDSKLLSKYKKLKDNYQDPIALVNENYCCSGCNMQIATLAVQLLKEDNGTIVCENCGRLLYMGQEKTQVS